MNFFVAMQNRRATASYFHPLSILHEFSEFLVVSRSGGRNEYLCISNAGASTGLEDEAPSGLTPDLAIFATLVSQGPDGAEIFVVERSIPEGATAHFIKDSRMLGGDGYINLRQSASEIALSGAVRLRPDAGVRGAGRKCLLLDKGEPGAVFHLDAHYLPWARELLPAEFRRAGQAP